MLPRCLEEMADREVEAMNCTAPAVAPVARMR